MTTEALKALDELEARAREAYVSRPGKTVSDLAATLRAALPRDGGPAFPGAELPAHPNHPTGMSLRDYFAAQTLVAMGTWVPHIGKRDPSPAEIRKARAHYAYAQADALLSARGEPK